VKATTHPTTRTELIEAGLLRPAAAGGRLPDVAVDRPVLRLDDVGRASAARSIALADGSDYRLLARAS
jgi:hypothetical protein